MGNKTGILWTDATWNIARGCTKVDEDCKFCYMYRDPKQVVKTKTVFNMPLKYKPEGKSANGTNRHMIFTSSLTDVFHPDIDSYRHEVWDIIRKCPHLIFQVLTKRPERIMEHLPPDWGSGWDNVWLGTSIGSDSSINRAIHLKKVPAKVRFLSIEPLWSELVLGRALMKYEVNDQFGLFYQNVDTPGATRLGEIHWVIIGGESGNETGKYRYRPCQLEWIEGVLRQAQGSGAFVFVKQLGTHLAKELGLKHRHGADMSEWPDYLKVQEFPLQRSPIRFV
ncbi:MAG: DUF5131 family protein [Pseudomonadota bacterium]|jgi:protein gp37